MKSDIEKAISLYEEAALKGNAAGYFRISLLYSRGNEIPQDLVKATEYEAKYCVLAKQNHDPFTSSCK